MLNTILLAIPLLAPAQEPVVPEGGRGLQERSAKIEALRQKLDLDGNGELDEAERQAVRDRIRRFREDNGRAGKGAGTEGEPGLMKKLSRLREKLKSREGARRGGPSKPRGQADGETWGARGERRGMRGGMRGILRGGARGEARGGESQPGLRPGKGRRGFGQPGVENDGRRDMGALRKMIQRRLRGGIQPPAGKEWAGPEGRRQWSPRRGSWQQRR